MSTRIVNDSMKKPEAGKSPKLVANPGYKLVQHTNGRKSPSISGYHVPDTRAMGGYEFVKSPAGKRTRVTQNVDVYEKPMNKEIEKPKSDVVLVIAIIVVIVLTVGTIISVTIAFFAVSDKEPLPNLTKLCREQVLLHNSLVETDCYFHLQKYPKDGCVGTECYVMGRQLKIGQNLTFDGFDDHHLTKIPNQTPCAPGKWCQEGVCVETKDLRVKQYDEIKPVDSYWVNSCGRRKCIFLKGKSKAQLENLTGECIDESNCDKNPNIQKVAFGCRYCTIPLYSGSFEVCFELPIHVIKNCGPCSSTVHNTNALRIHHECYEEGDYGWKNHLNGVPCDFKGSIWFCFQGHCVSDGSNDQQCLTKTNLTKS